MDKKAIHMVRGQGPMGVPELLDHAGQRPLLKLEIYKVKFLKNVKCHFTKKMFLNPCKLLKVINIYIKLVFISLCSALESADKCLSVYHIAYILNGIGVYNPTLATYCANSFENFLMYSNLQTHHIVSSFRYF